MSGKYSIKIKSASASDPSFSMTFECTNADIDRLKLGIRFNGAREFQNEKFQVSLNGTISVTQNKEKGVSFSTDFRRFGYTEGDTFNIQINWEDLDHGDTPFVFSNEAREVGMKTISNHVIELSMIVIA